MTEYVSSRTRRNTLWGQVSYFGYFHKHLYQCPWFLLATAAMCLIWAQGTWVLLDRGVGLQTVQVFVIFGMIMLGILWGRIVLQHRRIAHWVQREPTLKDKPESPLLVEVASSTLSLFWGCCFLAWFLLSVVQRT